LKGFGAVALSGGGRKTFCKKSFSLPRTPSFFSKNLKKGFCNSQIKALEHPMGFFL
jgi:hypothetical protein